MEALASSDCPLFYRSCSIGLVVQLGHIFPPSWGALSCAASGYGSWARPVHLSHPVFAGDTGRLRRSGGVSRSALRRTVVARTAALDSEGSRYRIRRYPRSRQPASSNCCDRSHLPVILFYCCILCLVTFSCT